MVSTGSLTLAIVLYALLLFGVALWGERKGSLGNRLSTSPIVYTFSLAVYCTAWTYYGSVGLAARSGFLFLSVYIGPTLVCIFAKPLLTRLAYLKHQYRITSVADFISARYGKSHFLAALTTGVLLIGVVPYVALQLKAVITTFSLLIGEQSTDGRGIIGPLLVAVMVLFTILFGVRRLDPTERHPGMMLALAVESLVKMVIFLVVGLFVAYGLFDGVQDIFNQAYTRLDASQVSTLASPPAVGPFLALVMSSVATFFLLPRQFHILVVENHDDRQLATVQWLFPLYLVVINLFVMPIALGGLVTGLPVSLADSYVLRLPMEAGRPLLSLLVFIGGFSAATGMIMITSMTMSTMTTNHLLLPIIERIPQLRGLRQYLLLCRWFVVGIFLIAGYLCYRLIGDTHILVNIGVLSFVAILQLAPAAIGGLFWRRANRIGAGLGILAGYLIWAYCLVIPTLVESGWLDPTVMAGPGGLSWLQPEHLFGLRLDPLTHAVFWSMLFNVSAYVIGSLIHRPNEQDNQQAHCFVDIEEALYTTHLPLPTDIDRREKECRLIELFGQYYPEDKAAQLSSLCLSNAGVSDLSLLNVMQLAQVQKEAGKLLSGTLGAAAAESALQRSTLVRPDEERALKTAYSNLLTWLKLTPEELREKINYHREREALIEEHNQALQGSLHELRHEVRSRQQVERELKVLNDELEQRVTHRTTELQRANDSLKSTLAQLEETQEQLVQSEKMSALGELVAGVAHEINTPVGISVTAATHLQRKVRLFEQRYQQGCLTRADMEEFQLTVKEGLSLVFSNLQKATGLIRSFKKVAVDQSGEEVRCFEVKSYLEDILASLRPKLKTTCHRIELECPEPLWIESYPGVFYQIFSNLIVNSLIHGFEGIDSGTITIRAVREGDNLLLEYRDNGRGVSEEVAKRIFDPFFTTKRHQGGSGLGMHIIYNLVTQRLAGQVKCDPDVRPGIGFNFRLPVSFVQPVQP